MAIRLIVTDLDGTYICGSKISRENKEAVEQAQKLGVKVVACTGRCWAMCDWLIPTLGFDDYCITSNGASIMHMQSNEIVYRKPLNPEWLPLLYEAAMKSGKPFDVYCGPFIHTFSPRRSAWTLRGEQGAKAATPGHHTKFRNFDTYESWLGATKDVAELFRVEVGPGESYPQELCEAVKKYGMGSNLTMSFADHYDLAHPDATKHNAIDFICQQLNISVDEVMALGDSNNDIGMIRYAGIGVAMGDAIEEVRKTADIVAPSGTENGFAWAVQKYVIDADHDV